MFFFFLSIFPFRATLRGNSCISLVFEMRIWRFLLFSPRHVSAPIFVFRFLKLGFRINAENKNEADNWETLFSQSGQVSMHFCLRFHVTGML